MAYHVNKYFLRILGATALAAVLAISVASCNNNQGGFSGSVGNTPNGPPLTSYRILGTPGTPFTATVSNARSSWTLQGNVPLSMIICNNVLPARIIATKTSSDSNLMSVQIINGNHVLELAQTEAPFGTVSLQTGGQAIPIAPHANPDLRIFVAGPVASAFTALIEDIQTGFVIKERAPTLIFFDTPNGKVDGTFFGNGRNFGTFTINMTLNGVVVASVTGGPNVIIREP
ncbi:MAG TPA: hypothetical protein VEO55_08520 [Candidatus Dormibacteraeota bacterium]|nr:hypothetical protein [Candidatus Dormibacteraeota bacterium]